MLRNIKLITRAMLIAFIMTVALGTLFLRVPAAYAQGAADGDAAGRAPTANSCTWTGATDTDWSTASNWDSCGGVIPQSADSVIIPNVTNDPILDADITINDLTLQPDAVLSLNTSSLTIRSGGTLSGDGHITGGVLQIGDGGSSDVTVDFAGIVDDVVIQQANTGSVALTQDLNVENSFTINEMNLFWTSNVVVSGTVVGNDSGFTNHGTSTIQLVGTADQLVTGTVYALDVAKPSGDVLITGGLTIRSGGKLSGNGHITGGVLQIGHGSVAAVTMDFAGIVDDVVIEQRYDGTVTLSQELNIENSLTINELNYFQTSNMVVSGTVTTNSSFSHSANSTIKLVGTGDQTVNGTGRLYNLEVAKPSGSVLIPSGLIIRSGGTLSGDGHITGGVLQIGDGSSSDVTVDFAGIVDDKRDVAIPNKQRRCQWHSNEQRQQHK